MLQIFENIAPLFKTVDEMWGMFAIDYYNFQTMKWVCSDTFIEHHVANIWSIVENWIINDSLFLKNAKEIYRA